MVSVASLAAIIAFAWRRFLGGEHSPFVSDIQHYHHPVTRELARAWAEGRIPLWTDHTYFGFPFFADPQTAAWYPGTLLVVGLGPHWGYVLFLVFHSLLAAVGMLGLMRSHGVAWAAAWASGLLVALSGYFAHEAQHPGLFAILCWLPTWLWASHAVFRRPTAGRVAGAAAALAMMLFAGTLQVLFGALILHGFYGLGLLLDSQRDRGWGHALRACGLVVLAQVLGLCLAAVMLIPAAAHLRETARALGMTYEFASMGSIAPLELLGLFVNGAATWLAGDLAIGEPGTTPFYLGSLTAILALVGLLTTTRRLPVVLSVGVVALVFVALGRYGGLHPLLYEWNPGAVGGLRGMGRALGPAAVGLAFLAGMGLQRLGAPGERTRLLYIVLLATASAAHAVAFWFVPDSVPGRTLGSSLVLSAALVLSVFPFLPNHFPGWSALDRLPALQRWSASKTSGGLLRTSAVVLVVADLTIFGALDGVLRANPPPPEAPRVADVVQELDEIAAGAFGEPGERLMLHRFGPLNLPVLQGIDGVGGYNPLVMLQYLDFVSLNDRARVHPRMPLDRFVSGAKPQRLGAALFDAASIRFVISTQPEAAGRLRLVKRYTDSRLGELGASLYENEDALPRAYLAYRTQHTAGVANLERLLGKGFDGRRLSIVEGEAPSLKGPPEITPVGRGGERPEMRDFDVSTPRAAILVVTDTWYPGWRAWVDGAESPVFRVNGLFKGVAVPAGAKRVEMRFDPWTFRVGAVISTVAVGVISMLVCLEFVRRGRVPGRAESDATH